MKARKWSVLGWYPGISIFCLVIFFIFIFYASCSDQAVEPEPDTTKEMGLLLGKESAWDVNTAKIVGGGFAFDTEFDIGYQIVITADGETYARAWRLNTMGLPGYINDSEVFRVGNFWEGQAFSGSEGDAVADRE